MQAADIAEHAGPRRNLVVIGASAGGVEVLARVVKDLPTDLRAAVCIVLHIAPGSPSMLAHILARAGKLPCRPARDGEPLRRGEILVAPPDHHLVIEDSRVRLTVGPRENGHRPAIDVLFRSAAAAFDSHVVGVVLSGTRDDGSAGLAVIKATGGGAIVQDPEDATYGDMPASAIASVAVDAIVPAALVGSTIAAMVNGEDLPPARGPSDTDVTAQPDPVADPVGDPIGNSVGDPAGDPPLGDPAGDPPLGADRDEGEQVTLVCPECGGVLSEHAQAGVLQWECRVGHRYSPETLVDAQAENVEGALWAAVRALADRAALLGRMAQQAERRGQSRSARRFRRQAEAASEQAELVRRALAGAAGTTLRRVSDGDDEERRTETEEGAA